MRKMFKKEIGITLVALVITIILLLILAGITISQLSGSGLFEKAKLAEQKSKDAQEKEEGILDDYENKISEYVDGTRNDEYAQMKSDIEYLKKQVKALQKNTIKYVDYTRILGEITTQGASYTATEDCAVIGGVIANNGYAAQVYVDGITVFQVDDKESTETNFSSGAEVIYIKKGSVFSTRANCGQYSFKIYGLLSVDDNSID